MECMFVLLDLADYWDVLRLLFCLYMGNMDEFFLRQKVLIKEIV